MNPQTATQSAKALVPVTQSGVEILDHIQQVRDFIARRAFEIFDNNGGWLGHDLDDWFRAESELLHPVHVEIAEAAGNLTVQAEVPGFSAKEIDIHAEPLRLTITGKRKSREESKKDKTIYSEQCSREILRIVDLPTAVDSSKMSAILKDGILNIELPKAAQAATVRSEPKAK